jgi:hypothetical protein
MEARSKLGASLCYRELFEGRLYAVVFLTISERLKRPEKLLPSSRGASG